MTDKRRPWGLQLKQSWGTEILSLVLLEDLGRADFADHKAFESLTIINI